MHQSIRSWGVFVGLAIGSVAPWIAGCDGEDPGPCVQGEACICEEDCNEACEGPGCGFDCEAGATCDFDCPEGSCAIECAPGSDCAVSCSGGGCAMNCSQDASCHIESCEGGSCTLNCGGSSDCTNACGAEQGCVTA